MTGRDLYQDMIMSHNKKPRNFKKLDNATHVAHGVNPLCGDDFYIFLKINKENIIEDIGFDGSGCAISKSSGSLLTSSVIGKHVSEATELKNCFIELITGNNTSNEKRQKLGKLTIFEGVKEYPIRVKCATLVWRALESALTSKSTEISEISTE